MNEYNLPTRQQCFELMEEFAVPLHIRRHNLAVARLGVFLAKRLKEKGVCVHVELVDRACLLHDIVRLVDFAESDYGHFQESVSGQHKTRLRQLKARYKSVCHEDAAYELFKERYPALALVIKRHRYAALLDEKEKPQTWEEKLVYYADKRVTGDRIVPLAERLQEAHRRNVYLRQMQAQSKVDIEKVDSLIFELEREIFAEVALDPAEITDRCAPG